jgi:glycosyltransferase involved in cell wall biosynthesis
MVHREDPLLEVSVENGVPPRLVVGRGQVLFIAGWAFHQRRRVTDLAVRVVGQPAERLVHAMPRADVFREHAHAAPRARYAYRSGFWGFLSVRPEDDLRTAAVELVATLSNGDLSTRNLGLVELQREPDPEPVVPPRAGANGEGPRLAICMATYNPRPDLFRRQIESLRSQTFGQWMCVVSDDCSTPDSLQVIEAELAGDPRFHISQPERRLGFYRNFERALSLAPESASLVALSDQDDRWYPEKLETLMERLDPDVTLAYGDMRVVGEDDEPISPTLFEKRRNNHTDLASLMAGNTVTGAASVFRRELLELALPFPQALAHDFHDQWLASIALYTGRISYVEQPIQDYVQHDANAFGAAAANRHRERAALLPPSRDRISQMLLRWRHEYFSYTEPVQLRARLLQLRASGQAGRRPRRAARRLASLEGSARSVAVLIWLYLRSSAARLRRSPSMGNERLLVHGAIWRRLVKAQSLIRRRRREIHAQAIAAPRPPSVGQPPEERPLVVRQLDQKIARIPLDVRESAPARVNMVIPTVDLEHFFGAYIAKFNLARCLAESGLRIRLVAIEPTEIPPDWRERVRSYEGLESLPDGIELARASTREELNLEVSPEDRFIATTSWTAHVAHQAALELGRERFLFLIQEYDPLTYPVGTLGATTREAYTRPHVAVFSTELLRDFFRQRRLGVYADGPDLGDRLSTTFRNAITPVDPPGPRGLANRGDGLLFYARPEQHAERNLFELGLMALGLAIRRGIVPREWQFTGIGAQSSHAYALEGDAELVVHPRSYQDRYKALLERASIGVALMDTPHPSLVPLEMASAGVLAITSTFATKTADQIRAISANLIPVEPSVEGVVDGLAEAMARREDYEGRASAARFEWPRRWQESFDEPTIARVRELLEQT